MDAGVLLGSSVLINFFRKRDKAASLLFRLIDEYSLYISVLTAFEVKVGVGSERHCRDYESLIQHIDVLPLDEACIEKAVEIYHSLKTRNALVGLANLLIAASASRYDLPIATLNQKHFERIQQVRVISP